MRNSHCYISSQHSFTGKSIVVNGTRVNAKATTYLKNILINLKNIYTLCPALKCMDDTAWYNCTQNCQQLRYKIEINVLLTKFEEEVKKANGKGSSAAQHENNFSFLSYVARTSPDLGVLHKDPFALCTLCADFCTTVFAMCYACSDKTPYSQQEAFSKLNAYIANDADAAEQGTILDALKNLKEEHLKQIN